MMKFFLSHNFVKLFSLVILTAVLVSWGSVGHEKISHDASLSFNPQMMQFNAWTAYLASHASDADIRKNTDPNEAPKHFINIDDFTEFVMTGRIPQTYDSITAEYGQFFVINEGILPWATKTTFDSIKSCFQRLEISKAEFFAADLGHYVADGHMPLHLTRNYNGQYSNNSGIHSRYESTMIGNYISLINYNGDSVHFIQDVNQYIFNYIYTNYTYKDSVLAADTYAKSLSGNTNSTVYKQALWDKTHGFTIMLFQHASHAIAELLYTAWIEAGSPPLTPSFIESISNTRVAGIGDVYPNPVNTTAKFVLKVNEPIQLDVELVDANGKTIETLVDGKQPQGQQIIEWNSLPYPAGLYYLVLQAGNTRQSREVLVIK